MDIFSSFFNMKVCCALSLNRLIEAIVVDIIVFGIISGDFLFYVDNGEAILMRTHNIPSCKKSKKLSPLKHLIWRYD